MNPDHSSKPRNKLIAQVFCDLGLIERYGSGIQRMNQSIKNAGLAEPILENFSGGFRIKFLLSSFLEKSSQKTLLPSNEKEGEKWGEKAQSRRIQLVYAIRNKPAVSIVELASLLGMSTPGVEKHLSLLK